MVNEVLVAPKSAEILQPLTWALTELETASCNLIILMANKTCTQTNID